jgi:hypothetical protein
MRIIALLIVYVIQLFKYKESSLPHNTSIFFCNEVAKSYVNWCHDFYYINNDNCDNYLTYIRRCTSRTYTEIELLDINLTKDSSLLRHAIQSSYWPIFKENQTIHWF